MSTEAVKYIESFSALKAFSTLFFETFTLLRNINAFLLTNLKILSSCAWRNIRSLLRSYLDYFLSTETVKNIKIFNAFKTFSILFFEAFALLRNVNAFLLTNFKVLSRCALWKIGKDFFWLIIAVIFRLLIFISILRHGQNSREAFTIINRKIKIALLAFTI